MSSWVHPFRPKSAHTSPPNTPPQASWCDRCWGLTPEPSPEVLLSHREPPCPAQGDSPSPGLSCTQCRWCLCCYCISVPLLPLPHLSTPKKPPAPQIRACLLVLDLHTFLKKQSLQTRRYQGSSSPDPFWVFQHRLSFFPHTPELRLQWGACSYAGRLCSSTSVT